MDKKRVVLSCNILEGIFLILLFDNLATKVSDGYSASLVFFSNTT